MHYLKQSWKIKTDCEYRSRKEWEGCANPSLGRYMTRHRLARNRPPIHSLPFFVAQTRASETTSPVVTNTKYAGEKCFAPPAALRHFLGSPASPGRITVRRNKRAAHYFYESSQYFPGGVGGPLSRVFPFYLTRYSIPLTRRRLPPAPFLPSKAKMAMWICSAQRSNKK